MARSGQITVTTAGTAVQGDDEGGSVFAFVAHPDNTDTVWVGGDGAGDVTSSSGYPLQPAGGALPVSTSNLNNIWFDADTNGEKICWIKLS